MDAYFHHHMWREVIDSRGLRMARKNTDKVNDTRAESKMKDSRRTSHRGRSPSPVAESRTFSSPT